MTFGMALDECLSGSEIDVSGTYQTSYKKPVDLNKCIFSSQVIDI